jgi:hypothetical protein
VDLLAPALGLVVEIDGACHGLRQRADGSPVLPDKPPALTSAFAPIASK